MERVMIYSHDTYGLGHLRRCLRVARALTGNLLAENVLIISGSPEATSFPMGRGIDIVKLPAVTKTSGGTYTARTIAIDLNDMIELRAQLVLAAYRSFSPDAVLVDHAPIGVHGELLPLFDAIRSTVTRPAVVFGMRDIVDWASKVEADWIESGAWPYLHDFYDGVLVYGDPVMTTTAMELRLASRLRAPVEHVGFVAPAEEIRPLSEGRRPTLVVSVGGGADGLPVLKAYAEFLERSPLSSAVRSVVVTGPFAEGEEVASVIGRLSEKHAEIVPFSNRMETLLATADGAVAMAGYNTIAELLAYRVPALLVPRRRPRTEQWIRATRLAALADLHPMALEDLEPVHFDRFVSHVLRQPTGLTHDLDLSGARSAAAALARLTAGRRMQPTLSTA